MSQNKGGVKHLPEKGAMHKGTVREPFQAPIAEEPEESNQQNALLLSNLPQHSPTSPRKGEIHQGRSKKFLVQKADENHDDNQESHANSNDRLQNDGNNNQNDSKKGSKSREGFGGPGPGSGDTKSGLRQDVLKDSGRGSSLSQELVFYFKPAEANKSLPSDTEMDNFKDEDFTQPLNEKTGDHEKAAPKSDKKRFRARILSGDKAVLLPGESDGDSSDDEDRSRHCNPNDQDKPNIFDKPKYSERFIERKGYHSDTSSVTSGPSLPGSPKLGMIRQFTVVNYGRVPTTPKMTRRQSEENVLPAVTKKISPVQTPLSQSPNSSRQNLSPSRNFLTVETDGPSQPSSRRGSFSLGSFYPQNIKNFKNIAKRGLLFAKRKRDRLLNKSGSFNISFRNISNRKARFLQDVYTTVLDASWFTTIMIFISGFCLTWISFGLLWWLIAYIRGDVGLSPDDTHKCVDQVHNWVSAFLFSLETQHTIGYGVRAITEECPEAVLLLIMQSILGVLSQCIVTGIVFSKLARPRGRSRTIMFSRNAVICQEDGEYCLLFRVGDMRHSQLVGAMLHAMFIKKRRTQEGHEIPFYQYHLEVRAESEDYDQFIFLSWPIRVIHRITPNSPLWGVSAEQLLMEDFEIIIVLEGVVEATSMTTQVRTSYLPSEILWGHSLAPLLTCQKYSGRYEIDFARFHQTLPVEGMPDESAKEYYEQMAAEEAAEDENDGKNENKTVANGNVSALNLIPPIQRAIIEESVRRMSVPQVFLHNLTEARQRKISVNAYDLPDH